MLDYIAGNRDFLSKLFNEPGTIDQTFRQRVEDSSKNNNPWGEIRNQYIAARNGLKDINVHPLERDLPPSWGSSPCDKILLD
jgi:hypothetical protein